MIIIVQICISLTIKPNILKHGRESTFQPLYVVTVCDTAALVIQDSDKIR